MNFVSLISGLVKAFNWISRYFERRQQRQDGRNEQIVAGLAEREKRRKRARGAVPVGMPDDPNNRDR